MCEGIDYVNTEVLYSRTLTTLRPLTLILPTPDTLRHVSNYLRGSASISTRFVRNSVLVHTTPHTDPSP